MSPMYTSRSEVAVLELQGSEHRLNLAQQTLRDFYSQHAVLVDGVVSFKAATVNARADLDREEHLLLVERDDAHRAFQKALENWSGFQK
jgi:hypothetical protein